MAAECKFCNNCRRYARLIASHRLGKTPPAASNIPPLCAVVWSEPGKRAPTRHRGEAGRSFGMRSFSDVVARTHVMVRHRMSSWELMTLGMLRTPSVGRFPLPPCMHFPTYRRLCVWECSLDSMPRRSVKWVSIAMQSCQLR